jgi:predicted nucleotidyltransferase
MNPNASPTAVGGKVEELRELCHRFNVERLEIFGSAATGAFSPESSDLDFVVDFGDQPLGPWGGLFLDFAAALEALFGRRVDVIMPQSIRNPYFRQAIDASRRLVMKLETKELVFEPWMAALAFGSCPFQIFSKLFQ